MRQLNLITLTLFPFIVCLNLASAQDYKVHHLGTPYLKFYSKYLDCSGIPVRSGEVVDDKALIIAAAKVDMMLKNQPVARKNLVLMGSEIHIIGKDQQTSDLPEFKGQKGVEYEDNGAMTDIDKRTRGMGGVWASCGEENLLHLPGDRYAGGYDICIHEFAHTLMDFGLDSALRKKIVCQYHASIIQGLWKGAYAAANENEYWAELTMWYFGFHGAMLPGKTPAPGPKALQAYDPRGYALLDSIYSGKLQTGMKEQKSHIVAQGTLSGTSKQKAKLVVVNNSQRPLKLFWIDQAGTAKPYPDVQPMSTREYPTYYTHVWMFQDGQSSYYVQVLDPRMEIKLAF